MGNKRKLEKKTRKSDDSDPEIKIPRCPVIAAGEEEQSETSPITVVMYPQYDDFIFTADFSLTVLNFYNYKNRTDFELVEALGDMGCLQTRHADTIDGDSSTKIFHAEILEDKDSRMVVMFCNILHDNKTGCEICDNKIFGSYRYSPNRILQPPLTPLWLSTDKEEDDIGIAKSALKHYNKSYHTNYEFLRYEASSTCIDRRMLCHVNFFAKPNKGVSDNRSSSKLFFTEWEQTRKGGLIHFCCILEGETNVPCFLCKPRCKDALHPLWGNWYG